MKRFYAALKMFMFILAVIPIFAGVDVFAGKYHAWCSGFEVRVVGFFLLAASAPFLVIWLAIPCLAIFYVFWVDEEEPE